MSLFFPLYLYQQVYNFLNVTIISIGYTYNDYSTNDTTPAYLIMTPLLLLYFTRPYCMAFYIATGMFIILFTQQS